MSLSDVLDVGVTMMLVLSPLLLRVCVVRVHICVTRDPSVGGTEGGGRGGGREGRERWREGGRGTKTNQEAREEEKEEGREGRKDGE